MIIKNLGAFSSPPPPNKALQQENGTANVTTEKVIFVCYYFPGVWYLNAENGKNIQLHFQEFDLENFFDLVEIRDGRGPDSLLLGK